MNVSIRIVAIPTAVAERVRSTSRSPGYGHPAHTEVSKGYGPCRHCLQHFVVGKERRILFTYDSFHGVESLPLPGPVFIHANACARYDENSDIPVQLLAHPLSLFAYGIGRRLREQVHADGDEVRHHLEGLLARPDVDYIQVHDRDAGCFDFRIERRSVTLKC